MKQHLRQQIRRIGMAAMAILLVCGTGRAEELDIRALHTLANTQDHGLFLQTALRHDSLTRSITTEEWYREIGVQADDSLHLLFLPTLYDLLANDYLQRRLPAADSVTAAWLAFHAHDTAILPRLYILLNTPGEQNTDSLTALYEAQPEGWERGYILTRIGDLRRQDVYRRLGEYLQQYPASPFAPNILHSKQCADKIQVEYSCPAWLRKNDSITISYSNTNAHEIVFELYRVLKEPKKYAAKRNRYRLQKTDSLRVSCHGDAPFHLTDQQCRMAPQDYGRYFLYARLPEDSLQQPVESLSYYDIRLRTFCISDLKAFLLYENKAAGTSKGRIVVSNAYTGEPVSRVWAKRTHDFPLLFLGNRRGEIQLTDRYYSDYSLKKGADKYRLVAKRWGHRDSPDECKLVLLPNATIFRPGDEMQLTVIAQKRHLYATSLLQNTGITVQIYDPRRNKQELTLTLDEDGTAHCSLPLTDEMPRGTYEIVVFSNINAFFFDRAYLHFRLEDYRLPTFSLTVDDSCRIMSRDRLRPVTGKAIRTNGMPIAGATVSLEAVMPRHDDDSFELMTREELTGPDGRFSIALSNRMQAHLTRTGQLTVTASLTAADGETHHTTLTIGLQEDTPPETQAARIAGVPCDSLLWLPKDSTLTEGRTVSMRLGVPRTCWVYCAVSDCKRLLRHDWQLLTPGLHTYTFTLPDQADDYLDIHFVTTDPDGNTFHRQRKLKGVTQTELHLIPVTMRDYLTPDTREKWTFRLTDAQGQPMAGRMVLTMTDKALQSVQSCLWPAPYLIRHTPARSEVNYQNNSNLPPYSVESAVPPLQHGFRPFLPLLYELYRLDSGQLIVVSGTVADEKGEPIIGAAILEQGTQNGTISDNNGHFQLAVRQNAILDFHYIGLQSVTCTAYHNMYVVLPEDPYVQYEEVVTTGFGNAYGLCIRGVGSLPQADTDDYSLDPLYGAYEPLVPLRWGDTRLAVYLPSLRTDANGEVHVDFLTPPDNTEWLVQAMAWARNGASDYLQRTLIARRTLMLRLQLPRFLRQGDTVQLPCIVSNNADTAQQVTVTLRIRTAAGDSLPLTETRTTLLPAHGTRTLFFPCHTQQTEALIVTAEVRATDGTADGEQRLLTVLPLAEPVSESLPFYLQAADTALTLCLPEVQDAENRTVTLLCCSHPLAYIAAQLPADVDSAAVTADQVAHNLYALALRNRLAKDHPALVRPVDITRLISELPLYQRTNGAFSWLKHSSACASFYLTLQVLGLLGELQEAGALENELRYCRQRAVAYLDREIIRRETAYRKAHHDSLPDYSRFAQYAYVRVLFDDKQNDDTRRILSATLDALYAQPNPHELTAWPLLALTFHRAGQHERAREFINGLRRYATMDKAHGMYWNNLPDRWWWYRQADIQAAFLLAFRLIDPQEAELDALRQWLILNNRTTRWGQSSLNAFASYALMYPDSTALLTPDSTALQQLSLPDTTVCHTIRHTPGQPAWGALMTDYTAPADRLQPFGTEALKLSRTIRRLDATAAEDRPLQKGELVRVTLTIDTDRELDNLIVSDRRPALLEPTGESGFQWMDGTLLYHEIRNTEERFYVEHLSRGTTVLTYDCYLTATGTTLAGLAEAASALAPEITAHTGVLPLEAQ